MTQIEAAVKLENFLNGSNFLVAHGAMDFTTIKVMLSKTKESPSFERIVKVDSQVLTGLCVTQRLYVLSALAHCWTDSRTG